MSAPAPDLLGALRASGAAGTETLVPLVYQELRRLAQHCLRHERVGHTLQATALVHEVYLRLIPQQTATWQDRGRFVAIAAHVMRQILVDHARARRREKRGGADHQRVPLDAAAAIADPTDHDRWDALDQALERLALLDARQVQIVELRYFGGLTVEETAELLRISPKTVKRDWSLARAWLRRELTPQD